MREGEKQTQEKKPTLSFHLPTQLCLRPHLLNSFNKIMMAVTFMGKFHKGTSHQKVRFAVEQFAADPNT